MVPALTIVTRTLAPAAPALARAVSRRPARAGLAGVLVMHTSPPAMPCSPNWYSTTTFPTDVGRFAGPRTTFCDVNMCREVTREYE
jgi:hypothetical protein